MPTRPYAQIASEGRKRERNTPNIRPEAAVGVIVGENAGTKKGGCRYCRGMTGEKSSAVVATEDGFGRQIFVEYVRAGAQESRFYHIGKAVVDEHGLAKHDDDFVEIAARFAGAEKKNGQASTTKKENVAPTAGRIGTKASSYPIKTIDVVELQIGKE